MSRSSTGSTCVVWCVSTAFPLVGGPISGPAHPAPYGRSLAGIADWGPAEEWSELRPRQPDRDLGGGHAEFGDHGAWPHQGAQPGQLRL